MAWVMLFVAGLFECAWAVGLKYSEGFTRPVPSALTIAAMLVSFWLLSIAMKSVPVGTAYAVWTGIGAAGVAVAGMLLFNEPRDLGRLFCISSSSPESPGCGCWRGSSEAPVVSSCY